MYVEHTCTVYTHTHTHTHTYMKTPLKTQDLWVVTYISHEMFIWCHMCSIGFRSGDSAGVRCHWIPCSSRKALLARLECLGSLSCTSRKLSCWYFSLTNGRRVSCKMLVMKNSVFIIPSKMRSSVAPRRLIPPQTWTFVGCFGLPLFLDFQFFFPELQTANIF